MAAHVLYPRDPSLDGPKAHSAPGRSGEPASPAAWVSPPARTASAGPASVRGTGTTALAPLGVAHPASFTLVTPDILALPTISEGTASAAQDAAHQRRPVQVGVRQPPRTAKRIDVADRRSVDRTGASPPAENASGQGDPIGDLLKKLGLGEG